MKRTQYLTLALAALLLSGCAGKANETTAAVSAAETISTEAAQQEADTAEAAGASGDAAAEGTAAPAQEAVLPDGIYTADFVTDSSMFRVNEACDGRGTLTVKNGEMTLHVSLVSKRIVNLYQGTAAEAAEHEADWLQPTTDSVTYSDGLSDDVYGFDIPVAALDTDFPLAILGEKGKWYDHVVSVTNAEPADADAAEGGMSASGAEDTSNGAVSEAMDAAALADGSYTCAVTLAGGSGRASVESPTRLTVQNGSMTAEIVWSSPNYDYMLADGEKYLPVNTDGNSVFEIPIEALDTALPVTADTVAMSTPHEIEYTLTFDSTTLTAE